MWFTYHVYHESPDWIRPTISGHFNIPYVIAEASHAPKQENDPWKNALAGRVKAIRRADAIIFVNPTDEACLENLRGKRSGLKFIPPFIEAKSPMTASERLKLREYLATEFEIDTSMPWLLCVAMMRLGAKRDSYKVLANAMADTTRQSFPLLIAGSGAVL